MQKSEAQLKLERHLMEAEQNAQEALNMLYDPKNDIQRSLWYRMTLGRAQSILMSLLVRELGKKARK